MKTGRAPGRPSMYGEPMMGIHALLPRSLYDLLDNAWRKDGQTRNDIVRAALAEYLNWTPKAEPQK